MRRSIHTVHSGVCSSPKLKVLLQLAPGKSASEHCSCMTCFQPSEVPHHYITSLARLVSCSCPHQHYNTDAFLQSQKQTSAHFSQNTHHTLQCTMLLLIGRYTSRPWWWNEFPLDVQTAESWTLWVTDQEVRVTSCHCLVLEQNRWMSALQGHCIKAKQVRWSQLSNKLLQPLTIWVSMIATSGKHLLST